MSDIDYNQKYPHNTIKYGEKKDNKKFLEYEGDIRDITFRNDDKKNIEDLPKKISIFRRVK